MPEHMVHEVRHRRLLTATDYIGGSDWLVVRRVSQTSDL